MNKTVWKHMRPNTNSTKEMKSARVRFVNGGMWFDHVGGSLTNIMAGWEGPMMEKHVEIMCDDYLNYSTGRDILEIGFGMGLSADYIQNMCNINSHTIIEINSDVAKMAREWAKDKVGVNIIEADWWDVKDEFTMYDGILYDAEYDPHVEDFWDSIKNNIKEGGVFTFYWHVVKGEPHHHPNIPEYLLQYENMDIRKYKPIERTHEVDDYTIPYVVREFGTSF